MTRASCPSHVATLVPADSRRFSVASRTASPRRANSTLGRKGCVGRRQDRRGARVRRRTGPRWRADEVLQRATNTASDRTRGLIARLHLEATGFDVGVDVRVEVRRKTEDIGVAVPPITHPAISWKAAQKEGLFPSMSADLALSPMTFAETRVEFEGTYRPPLALVGKVFDAAVGHRIAEATVHRFVNDLIEEIRRQVPQTP